jgi:hypothetical protein
MVVKRHILHNLYLLERSFNNTTNPTQSLFYSKLAILELCGWIEKSMDDIILRIANLHLRQTSNHEVVEKNIILRTFGFEYKKHFRRMMSQLIGIIFVEKLEKELDQVKFQIFQSTLDTLKEIRNKESHTHIKGTTRRLDSPSMTKNRFFGVFDGLKDIETKLRSFRFRHR